MNPNRTAEARQIYELWWTSYFSGDEVTFASLVDDGTILIGTAEDEVCFGRSEVMAFVRATIDQVAGKVEMRERDVRVAPVGDLVQIDELADMYVLIDNRWTMYAKLRLSSLLRQIDGQWKVNHQHASFPDHRAQEGETLGFEQIQQENLQLREAVKRRTIELEAKNQQLELEACLERVRVQAIAMKRPKDLLSVSEVLFKELIHLGFDFLRNAMIDIYDDERHCFFNYDYSDAMGPSITNVRYDIHPVVERHLRLIRGAHDAFEEMVFTGTDLEDWKEFRRCNGEQDDPRLDRYPALYYYFYSIGLGDIGISTFEPIGEAKREILKRFRNVFDLAYRRYIDVRRAEEFAREAQIELALERIRARSLAMHRSAELVDASDVFFEQLSTLGIEAIRTGVATFDESKETVEVWSRSQSDGKSGGQIVGIVPRKAHLFFDRCFEAWKRKEPYFAQEFNGDEVEAYYRHMTGVVSYSPANSYNPREVFYTFFFAEGSLNVVRQERLSDEELTIMRRFASVFGQIYRRFLDLKQAEVQAREAQIEAALERVRSRTMAMQRSDELIETSFVLFEQLAQLGEVGEQVTIGIIDDDAGTMEMSATSHGNRWKHSTLVQINEHEVMRSIHRGWKEGKRSLVIDLSGEELVSYNAWRKQLKDIKNVTGMAFTDERWVIHSAYFSKGNLSFSTSNPRPAETVQLLERFASVFDLTYTRFLDLKQAEAQAREATIEAALERVRSKAMAMRNSNDLSVTSGLVFTELRKLGITSIRCGVVLLTRESRDGSLYFTSSARESDSLNHVGIISLVGHPSLERQYGHWLDREDYLVTLQGEELVSYYEWLHRQNPVPFLSGDQSEQVEHGYYLYFAEGQFYAWTQERYTDEQLTVLNRFKAIIELTFRRYLDLQKAEAQAREAQIEASLERIRARTMAMQRSEELRDAATLLFQQVKSFGISTGSCGYHIWELEKGVATVWMSSPEGGMQTPFRLVHNDSAIYRDVSNAKGNGEDFMVKEVEGEELKRHFDYLATLPGIGDEMRKYRKTGYTFPEKLIYHFAFFNQGYLSFHTHEPHPEAWGIFKRFANVFEQTYTRFLDLQKAEAQAKEAQIETCLERVRSRTLAMQRSDELAETAAVLFRQLIALGIAPNRLYIAIINDEVGNAEFWITDEDGSKVSSGFAADLNSNQSFRKMLQGWRSAESSLTIDMQGEELQEYFRHLSTLDVPFKGGLTQTRRVQTIAFFSKGFLGIASPNEQPAETTQLLERFAAVFNLTFTRFSDLKLAEAQAHQAHLDLIQLQAEKQRAEEALSELRDTQVQLLQQEKLASLGQLTAGIAHEIKNPLNFVNNFSSVSLELLDEAIQELTAASPELMKGEAKGLLADIRTNLTKIIQHGTRADGIVKSMLQHSRGGSGRKEPVDLNGLVREFSNLAFHGMRAAKNPINVDMVLELQDPLEKVNLIAEDFSRVIINLCQNAFDAMRDKVNVGDSAGKNGQYLPKLTIRTRSERGKVIVELSDNGPGIPAAIRDKILQPFFTTKKGTQGTGLGLSITDDIVKAHGGVLTIESNNDGGATFVVELPSDTR